MKALLRQAAAIEHATGVFGTSHAACALGLFDGSATLGARGVPIGPLTSGPGGLFSYDPWEIYGQPRKFGVTGTNVTIAGAIGSGKTTGTQTYLRRQHPCGRYIRVIDPRGEYRRLCADLGGEAIALSRGGGITLNPLESPDTKHELLRSVASAAARRALNEYEPALLNTALDAAGGEPTLPVVLDRLFHPSVEMAQCVATTPRRFAHEARSIAMALQPLCEGDLRGLFDGPTTAGIDFTNPFVCLDLSELYDDQSLGILMACAIAFLQAQIDAHYRQGELRDEIPKSILVVDEAWRILALPGVGAWLRKAFKFSRKQAQQNIAIMHGFRDLDAAGDDGSTVTKVARGLARDCQTFVLYKMSEADADEAQALLGLTDVERDILVWGLERGDALWCVGGHRFVVTTYATASDLQVTSPDEAMRV